MQQLPRRDDDGAMPDSITLEPKANGLAGLAETPELSRLTDMVVAQWKRGDIFDELAKYRIFPIRNVFMYGPPGNGKTTACQVLASKIGCPLYRVRCESLVGSYIGETARLMRGMMDFLAKQSRCVVLFDEVESIFPSREILKNETSREIASAMTVFWQTLDRWTTPQLFCFATNMPDRLDPALMSRFELKLEFGPPNQDQVRSVVAYWREIFHEYKPETWAPELVDRSFVSYRELWQAISDKVRATALAMASE
jgi:ATP-dependent 26S proteasome regulatory subunit